MWRPIATLAGFWCVLVIAPALIARQVLEATGGSPKAIWSIGIWVLGYMAQLLVFRAISRRAPRPTILGWLLAAVMPWAADWLAPVWPWAVALCALVVLAYAAALTVAVARVDRLRAQGLRGTAVVLEVIRPVLYVVVNKVRTRRKLRLRVEEPSAAAGFETQRNATFEFGEVPEPGDRVTILLDPTDPRRMEVVEGEPVARSGVDIADLEPAVAEQLHRLAAMRDRGDITDSEFHAARSRLLEG